VIPLGIKELGWLLLCMLPFFFIQTRLHRELKLLFFVILRRDTSADLLFYILFFPGILVHETSHWLMAKILRVPTGRFSLIPKHLPNGKLRLGYVETQRTDWLRDSLIGAAPLVAGALITGWLAATIWHPQGVVDLLWNGDMESFWNTVEGIYLGNDFWIWFYLIFTISSMMLPSESDRSSWLPVILIFVGILILLIVAGAGGWMESNLIPFVSPFILDLVMVFSVSLVMHILLLLPVWGLRAILVRLVGYP
jgi:hypothetical protein